VRQGKISEALDKLKTEWTSLPGASQNAHRRNAAGKPMDMGYFMSLYEGYLTEEKRKAGLQ
jgi:muramidase (phage lysozyme)